MNFTSCGREKEVAGLLERGQWPEACPQELRTHVGSCSTCGDLVLVKEAFATARRRSMNAAAMPSPGVLWWRAQLRRRNEAVTQVGKPMVGAQIFALTVFALAAVGLVASRAQHGIGWLRWLIALPQSQAFHMERLWSFSIMRPDWSAALLAPVVAALALLSVVAVYLAAERQ